MIRRPRSPYRAANSSVLPASLQNAARQCRPCRSGRPTVRTRTSVASLVDFIGGAQLPLIRTGRNPHPPTTDHTGRRRERSRSRPAQPCVPLWQNEHHASSIRRPILVIELLDVLNASFSNRFDGAPPTATRRASRTWAATRGHRRQDVDALVSSSTRQERLGRSVAAGVALRRARVM